MGGGGGGSNTVLPDLVENLRFISGIGKDVTLYIDTGPSNIMLSHACRPSYKLRVGWGVKSTVEQSKSRSVKS